MEQNFTPAKIALAIQKLKSSPPNYNPEAAEELLTSVTDDDTGTANYLLGELYAAELIQQPDHLTLIELSHDYFKNAANSGHVEAMLQLAYGYRHGIFLCEMDDKGCFWLQKAAEKKHPRALFELAIHKAYGIGCDSNITQAQGYIKLVLPYNYPNAAVFSQSFQDKKNQNLTTSKLTKQLHQQPIVSTLHNVLDVMECSHLAVLSMPFLQPSKVISSSGEGKAIKGRTSMGTNFPPYRSDFVVNSIVRRLSKIAGQAANTSEYLALLKYGEGQEYRVHPDYFDANEPGLIELFEQGGQRIKTIVCYLNTVQKGGQTAFPDLGLTVSAVAGSGVFFENADSEGVIYPQSRHAGLPIIEGSKWIVTLWFRKDKHRQ